MTHTAPPQSPVGIHSIERFALAVPDLAEEERFLRAFGLEVARAVGAPEALELRTSGSEHLWAQVLAGPRKKLLYVSLGCYAQDFEAITAQIVATGGVPANAHPQGPAGGFWFHDPDGTLLQLVVSAKTMPDGKAAVPDNSVPVNVRGAPPRSAARRAVPTRLTHMALFASNVSRSVAFYNRALGLRLSDRSGELIAFLYAPHGCDHHLLAFVTGGGGGLHHSSWDVPSQEEVGLGNTQMRAAGYHRHFGPGRHVLGSNYFNYVKDSFGQWWEHSAHLDYIGKDRPWEGLDLPAPEGLTLWGPGPEHRPEEFHHNTELGA